VSRDEVDRGSLVAPSVLGVVAQAARSGAIPGLGGLATGDPLTERTAEALAGRALAGGALERDDVTLAWELARLAPTARRVEALGLVLAVLEAVRRGSTQLRLGSGSDPVANVAELAESLARGAQLELPFAAPRSTAGASARTSERSADPLEAPLAALAPLVGAVDDPRAPLVHDAGRVALRRWAATEWTIARDLAARAGAVRAHEGALALVASLRSAPLEGPRGPMQLTDEQEAAVAAMLSERTIVLTGGPGTGKTSVVVSLLRALARRAHAEGGLERVADEIRRVALAAPTGKAADRLGDAVRSALSRSADPIDAAGLSHEPIHAPSTARLSPRPGPLGQWRLPREPPQPSRAAARARRRGVDDRLLAVRAPPRGGRTGRDPRAAGRSGSAALGRPWRRAA
jgi:hypothetical protein